MCIAVPSKVIEIKEDMAVIDVEGVQKEAGLALMDDIRVGDWVIVHAGFVIHKMDAAEAQASLALLKEALIKMETPDVSDD